MPIYNYKCDYCERVFEKIVKNSQEKVACECGCVRVDRIFDLKSNFHLKGDCWAKDGYTKKEKSWEKHMQY